jgi:cytochrome c oxidase cbb3-type subunit 2
MKNLHIIYAGVFFTIAFSWGGLVLSSQIQQADLVPVASEEGGQLYPRKPSGYAIQGKDVYISQGCNYCHSQQVRPAGMGGDIARGWGQRTTVSRDYILQDRVLLGTMRTGPDLADIGGRQSSDLWHYLHLFDPQITSPGSNMPSFRQLFELRRAGATPSKDTIPVPPTHAAAAPAGYEWVPNERGRNLVAYLRSLKLDYNSPEAKLKE